MKRNTLLSLGLVATGLVMAAPVSAGDLLTDWQEVRFTLDSLNATTSLSFNGFDSALGNLESVHLTFTADATLNNNVFSLNQGDTPIGVPDPLSAIWTITATGPEGLAASAVLATPGFAGDVPTGGPTLVGTITTPIVAGPEIINGDPTSLATYIGGSNSVSISLAGVGTQGGSVPAGVFTGNDGNAEGSLAVRYDYSLRNDNQIPEPASLGLMGMGFAAMAAARRRKSF